MVEVGLKRASVVPNKKELGQIGRSFGNTFLFQTTNDLLGQFALSERSDARWMLFLYSGDHGPTAPVDLA